MEALGQTSFRLFLGRTFLIQIDAHSNGLRLSVLPLLLQLLQWTAYVKILNNLSFQRSMVATGNGTCFSKEFKFSPEANKRIFVEY